MSDYDKLKGLYESGKVGSDKKGNYVGYDGFKWRIQVYSDGVVFSKDSVWKGSNK